ncbi:MAG: hypothetical protein ABF289_12690 [Clostridiales bacterium]
MEFQSILFNKRNQYCLNESVYEPEFFCDLNLDQLVNDIVENKEEYNLKPFFYLKLKNVEDINYRLDIMKEFDNNNLYSIMYDFSANMKRFKEYKEYSETLYFDYQLNKWFLDSADLYCRIVLELNEKISILKFDSLGFRLFQGWIESYINSDEFKIFSQLTFEMEELFSNIKYNLKIFKNKVLVTFEKSEGNYCDTLSKCFDKINDKKFDFKLGIFKDVKINPIEDLIIKAIKEEKTELFERLSKYRNDFSNFENEKIMNFIREIQFYISYIDFMNKLRKKGYVFSYPKFSDTKIVEFKNMYDLALANKNSKETIIRNDLFLEREENVLILSGPNQGGKTTYARAFGQASYLAFIGCPIACDESKIYLFDNVYTHFSNDENINIDTGKLKEELVRLEKIIKRITPNSLLILNELFATTTTYDGYNMGKDLIEYLIELECVCLYVTHIFELSKLSRKIVNLVACVDSSKNRTYKILRKDSDGKVYANTIAEKYDLSYKSLKKRLSNIN